jgi:uncharacterized membrane protein YsdA (DUF1294 family)
MSAPSTPFGWLFTLIFGLLIPFLFAFAAMRLHENSTFPWWSAYLIAANAVAFLVYAFDKLLAKAKWLHIRVPESVLAWEIPLLGGGYGALLGMAVGHKTNEKHAKFQNSLYLANALFLGFWAVALWQEYLTLADANRIAENFTVTVLDTAASLVEAVNAGLSS